MARIPTADQVLARQKADHEKPKANPTALSVAKPATQPVPGKPASIEASLPALPETRTPVQQYIDEIAPSNIAGKLVKFSKEGAFAVSESGEQIADSKDFVAMCDETLIGWIKFSQEGEPPARVQGLLYDDFRMPSRESLGDLNPRDWPMGLDKQPADPWQHQICLVLQDRETQELYTFATPSVSGCRAIGNLLRHYDRLRKSHPDTYPVVRLKAGGFNHRDERIGWVNVPVFVVVGRAPKASVEIPDTSPEAILDDKIPW
jgi:hypothetical protein